MCGIDKHLPFTTFVADYRRARAHRRSRTFDSGTVTGARGIGRQSSMAPQTAWGTTDYTPRPPSSRARGGHAPRHRRLPAVPARPAPAWAGTQARCPPGPWRGEHAAPRGSPIARSARDRRAPCGRDGARLGVGARTGRAGAERARARGPVSAAAGGCPGARPRAAGAALSAGAAHPRNSAARARDGSGHRAAAELAMLPTLLGSEGALARPARPRVRAGRDRAVHGREPQPVGANWSARAAAWAPARGCREGPMAFLVKHLLIYVVSCVSLLKSIQLDSVQMPRVALGLAGIVLQDEATALIGLARLQLPDEAGLRPALRLGQAEK